MKAELINSMGSDLTVVNAARVSFDKESEWAHPVFGEDRLKILWEKDQKLISYLAKHNHFTPFTHVTITMRETVPIFVARQRFKHMVGFTYNEVSRRYVDDEPDFYYPEQWRKRAENLKQGSSDEVVSYIRGDVYGGQIKPQYERFIKHCSEFYKMMIDSGVAPEQARMVLPQSMYTSYYVTGSLAAWARAYRLRSDAHAQAEIRELASQWNTIISTLPELKYSWTALTSMS